MTANTASSSTMPRHPTYSIFTHSVGYHTASHSLLTKLDAIASAGIQGVEIFTDDLWAFAQSSTFTAILSATASVASSASGELLTPPDSPLSRPAQLRKPSASEEKDCYSAYGKCTYDEAQRELAAAAYVAKYCEARALAVVCLQPLRDVEGWVRDEDRSSAMERVRSRFAVMQALNTELLLICSSNTPAPLTTGDTAAIVRDFRHISAMASEFSAATGHSVKVGYEALSWGAHVDVWSHAWHVVRDTARDNVGLILDSFNTLAREFADPCSPTGIQEPADRTLASLSASIARIADVPGDKIFLLQIGDACRMPKPLLPSPREDEPRPARMIWSRSSRLFPCEVERGAFMPVAQFVRAVVKAGYSGAWSIEVFNDSLDDADGAVPAEHAVRARAGLDRLVEAVYA
ncbi:related to 3-dehydroshikimate dehydratase [Sporisorium reilianum SRZ2]|uniref:Related to 3-dehydroshikimate dehydratase n=1 Tax=Sporisorium reilianum (strain SRZ2) TaxID=999809 RepID=E6ZSJ0_SPORE|nr:related to 3-dehydroshikimate dehydratase [Sporisorium reilianum SRZ2]